MSESRRHGTGEAVLLERAQAKGFRTLSAFAGARPAVTIFHLAKELGPDVSAAQVVNVLLREASSDGRTAALVTDLMARFLSEALESGWPPVLSERAVVAITGALARWIAHLPEEWEVRAKTAARTLLEHPPPVGWRPSGADDPVIVTLFPKLQA